MKVKNPTFITSAFDIQGYPQHNLLEISFSGRSNVGKSSMINKLLNRSKLARTSSQPGRTQSINFFNIDDRFSLVDLPGYGFAKAPKRIKDQWAELIDDYLHNRPNLVGIVQIVDARHKPTSEDVMMVEWLLQTGLSTLVVATKVDKISKGQRAKQEKLIKSTLGIGMDNPFCFFSANTGEGTGEVTSFIMNVLNNS